MNLHRRLLMLLLMTNPLLVAGGLRADGPPSLVGEAREITVVGRNPTPGFMVHLDADRADRTYLGGEKMTFTVRSERAGHLYLISWSAEGKATCLFPNQFQQDNRIEVGKGVMVPSVEAKFDLEVGPPYGAEVVKAIVTPTPLKQLPLDELVKAPATPLEEGRAKTIFVKQRAEEKPESWAEHHIVVYTADPSKPRPMPQPRRVGLFIGLCKYRCGRVLPLSAPGNDARGLCEALALDAAVVLVDEKATLAEIERVFREEIVAKTRPGDVVFIYWSGHGGRSSSTDKEEKDGYEEYLVPFDGDTDDSRRTMLGDNAFGRWMQDLDGRRIVVILDACYSAGQHAGAKGAKSVPTVAEGHLFSRVLRRVSGQKDVNQKDVAFLASSTATQISMERRDGKHSVMTHYLIEFIKQSKSPLSLDEVFAYLKVKVPAYVESNYRGSTQMPVLIDLTTKPLFLNK